MGHQWASECESTRGRKKNHLHDNCRVCGRGIGDNTTSATADHLYVIDQDPQVLNVSSCLQMQEDIKEKHGLQQSRCATCDTRLCNVAARPAGWSSSLGPF
eukprot:1575202-Rhodomonas_salina.1